MLCVSHNAVKTRTRELYVRRRNIANGRGRVRRRARPGSSRPNHPGDVGPTPPKSQPRSGMLGLGSHLLVVERQTQPPGVVDDDLAVVEADRERMDLPRNSAGHRVPCRRSPPGRGRGGGANHSFRPASGDKRMSVAYHVIAVVIVGGGFGGRVVARDPPGGRDGPRRRGRADGLPRRRPAVRVDPRLRRNRRNVSAPHAGSGSLQRRAGLLLVHRADDDRVWRRHGRRALPTPCSRSSRASCTLGRHTARDIKPQPSQPDLEER